MAEQVPLEQEIDVGRWPRVRARLRPLRAEEMPPTAEAMDDNRLVEYYAEDSSDPVPDSTGLRPYTPLRDPDVLPEMVRTFARDESPSEAEVVAFYAGYGPLGGWRPKDGTWYPDWVARVDPEHPDRVLTDARMIYTEPLWWVREKARGLRLTYQLYAGLRDDRTDFLRSLLGEVPKGKKLAGVHIIAGRLLRDVVDDPEAETRDADVPEKARPSLEFVRNKSQCRQLATKLLADQLNLAEQRSHRWWVDHWLEAQLDRRDRPSGRPRPEALELTRVRRVSTLWAAAYLQLAELVDQRAALRQCVGCGGVFFPRRTNQQYCTARCGDAARQRAHYRERKQGKKRGPRQRPAAKH